MSTEKRIALENSAGSPLAASAAVDQTPCENCGKLQDTKTAKLQKKKYCSPLCAKTAKTSPAEIVEPAPSALATNANATATSASATATPTEAACAGATVKQDKDELKTSKPLDTAGNTATVKPNQEPVAVQSAAAILDPASLKGEPTNALTTASAAASITPAVAQGPQLHEWSVAEVCDFIRALPGCADYAEDFENQEIDGQALLLLKPNNLVSVMNIKLGPALKIIDRVNVMRGAAQDD